MRAGSGGGVAVAGEESVAPTLLTARPWLGWSSPLVATFAAGAGWATADVCEAAGAGEPELRRSAITSATPATNAKATATTGQ